MTDLQTQLRIEVLEIPASANRLLTKRGASIPAAAAAIRSRDPAFMADGARGSSDHVAKYLKYASELLTGTPIASIRPASASAYRRDLMLNGSACLPISQSGKSPDIVAVAQMARRNSALLIAMTDHMLNPHTGPEISVAAAKTFVKSAVAGIRLLAEYARGDALRSAIHNLQTKTVATQAALKFKETCQTREGSYSSAEVLHGPVAIIDAGFPVITLAAADEAEQVFASAADEPVAKDAQVFATSAPGNAAKSLLVVGTGHPLTDPLSLVMKFHTMVERIAAPRHPKKVTQTL